MVCSAGREALHLLELAFENYPVGVVESHSRLCADAKRLAVLDGGSQPNDVLLSLEGQCGGSMEKAQSMNFWIEVGLDRGHCTPQVCLCHPHQNRNNWEWLDQKTLLTAKPSGPY